jgi:NAD(P)-dependent dehydrogenase (short-subunit alcohol dehydrogenase family)
VVDFDTSLQPDQIADRLCRELLSRAAAFEIGYPGGKRTVFKPKAVPLHQGASSADLMPKPGWVVLATGGARGITAAIAERLVVPGVRLVIVGQTPHPGDEDPQLAALTDAAALRRHFVSQAKAAGETLTPAAIERRVGSVVKAREIRRNLSALKQRGADVEYVAADVREPASLSAVIESVYNRHGAIHAVLHGAGVIEDKLLADKSRESFERVFDTKADSTFLLSRALRPEHLRWIVLMSSISGRIGNRGQVDYAAANEVMNRLAWEMARKLPSTRVLSINWGPWRGAGMTTDSVLPQLEARGIRAIEPDAGWRFLHDELTTGAHDVVEVIAGDGV